MFSPTFNPVVTGKQSVIDAPVRGPIGMDVLLIHDRPGDRLGGDTLEAVPPFAVSRYEVAPSPVFRLRQEQVKNY